MAPLCALCQSEPSKYKCPTCQIPYCSLACYKPHKIHHKEESPKEEVRDALKEEEEEDDETLTAAPQGYKSWPPDFYALPANPEFQSLMKRYPALKIQLGGVFLNTLEPPPEREQTSQGRPQRFGRGGRGGYRGGRGGTPRKWTKEKGEKDAFYKLQRLESNPSSEYDGLREFVKLISTLYEKEKVTTS